MPLYTFYPTLKNGLCDTFQSVELESDDRVADWALATLNRHPSAASVVVYSAHRKVMTHLRTPRESGALRAPRGLELPVPA